MKNRIINLNGEPAKPELPSVPDMIKTARARWKLGEKDAAFDLMSGAAMLLSDGVARLFLDVKEIKERMTPK
jgi:hypothetical protein